MTNQEIIDAGQVIFDEESVGANTSERVGAVIKGIGQNLIAEENARTSADTTLGHRIDDEETARLAAESGLGGEIDAEALARQNADNTLGVRIDNEKTARENADTALGERIDDLSDDLANEVQDLQDAISSEESARQSAVNNLGDAISDETLARQNADNTLGGRIDAEKTDRENADNTLGGRIDTEKTDRENADNALGGRIDDLSDDLADEVEARQTAITNEETARQQADLTLGGRIDAEKTDREAADGELGTRITGLSDGLVAEVSAREAADNAETAAREAAVEGLGNTNFLLSGNKDNIFDKSYVRVGKGIRNVDETGHGEIVDAADSCITGYYAIPPEADYLHIKGAKTSGGYPMKFRFTSGPTDDDENVRLLVIPESGSLDIDLSAHRARYPNLKYFCCNVYRGGQTSALGTMSIVFEDSEETAFVDSVKEVIDTRSPILLSNGFVNTNGIVSGESSSIYQHTQHIPVSEGERYHIVTRASSSVAVVAMYDSNDTYNRSASVIGVNFPSGDTDSLQDVDVLIPEGIAYLVVSCHSTWLSSLVVTRVGQTSEDVRELQGDMEDVKETVQVLDGDSVSFEWSYGYVNAQGIHDLTSGNYQKSEWIPVQAGDIYSVGVSGSQSVYVVSFYASQDFSTLINYTFGTNAYQKLNVEVPSGASWMLVVKNTTYTGDYSYHKNALPLRVGKTEEQIGVLQSAQELTVGIADTIWSRGFINLNNEIQVGGTTYFYSGLIPVVEDEHYLVGISGSISTVGVLFYDSAEAAIGSTRIVNNGSYQQITVAVPVGSAYMRLTKNTANDYAGDFNIYKYGKVLESIQQGGGESMNTEGSYWMRERMKYGFFDSPKKPCISFQMDINGYSASDDSTQAFVDKLKALGIAPTFFILPRQLKTQSILDRMRGYVAQGVEVTIHSDPLDGIGVSNDMDTEGIDPNNIITDSHGRHHPKTAYFRTILERSSYGGVPGYLPQFLSVGVYPTGWVNSQGAIFVPSAADGGPYPLGDYMEYGHTTANGGLYAASDDLRNPLNFVNDVDTAPLAIDRWGVEQTHDKPESTDQDVIDACIRGLEATIENNGLFIIYCHSYNMMDGSGTTYTLRETVLNGILEYLRPFILRGQVMAGTTSDIVKYYYDRISHGTEG